MTNDGKLFKAILPFGLGPVKLFPESMACKIAKMPYPMLL
jgi:hypothetical protein